MVIFKDGDDVRQDQLCLQMFKIMMEKWEENDLVIPMVRREKREEQDRDHPNQQTITYSTRVLDI
jgi:hypothetical protein